MTTNTITQLSDPQGFSPDPLTDLLRSGAQRLIQQAVEAELAALLEAHASDKTDDGRARLVRHGHLPEREIMTGIGAVPVQVPRVRDRGDGEEKNPLHVNDLATLSAQSQIHRGVAALALSQRHFHRRLSRGTRGSSRPERGGAVFDHDIAPQS